MYKIIDNKKIQIEDYKWWNKSQVEKMSDVIVFENDKEKESFIIALFNTLPFQYDECDRKILIVMKRILDSTNPINSRLGMMQPVHTNYEEWIKNYSVEEQLTKIIMKEEQPLFLGHYQHIREYLDDLENTVNLLLLTEKVDNKLKQDLKIIEKRMKK